MPGPANLRGGPLSEADLASLATRWISPEFAALSRLRRVDSMTGAEVVGRENNGSYSGILIPYLEPGTLTIRAECLRRDTPDMERRADNSVREVRKYLVARGTRNMLYFPAGASLEFLQDVMLPLVIIEGEFKCIALWRLAWHRRSEGAETPAFLPVGLRGVSGWRQRSEKGFNAQGARCDIAGPIADLWKLQFHGRRCTICFDLDVETNLDVFAARRALTRDLEERGAEVAWFRWPKDVSEQVKGVDDFLAACGPERVLKVLAKARTITRRIRVASTVQIPVADWKRDLIRNDSGGIKPILANAILALRRAPEWNGVLSFNEFALRTCALTKTPWGGNPRDWTDTDDIRTADWLQWQGIHVSPKVAGQAVETVAKEGPFHPVRDYYNSLEWDGEKRLLQWAFKYLGVKVTKENQAYVEAVGSRWLISAVARIMVPGAKADCCLILEGLQGIKKSTALRALASTEWFTDSIPSLEHKDSAIQLLGKLIVEFSELDRLSRSEVTLVKSYVSRAVDRFRPPFGTRAADFGRQCIFAGTVNRAAYLADETGARRFWPLTCGQINIDALEDDRDQIWAEAVAMYRAGTPWWLDTVELNQQASAEQLDRYEGDAWEDPIREWVADPTDRLDQHGHPVSTLTSTFESVTVSDVLIHCLGKAPHQWVQSDMNRVARCLQVLGFARRKVGPRHAREYRYFRQKTETPTASGRDTVREEDTQGE
jgi:hypothetical protein